MSNILLTLSRLNWSSTLDILLVAFIFYCILVLIQGTQAVQLLRGILLLVVVAIILTNILELTAFSWLIRNSLPALLVAIPVIFQPELRRALDRLGRTNPLFSRAHQPVDIEHTLDTISSAALQLSKMHLGALIVLERETGLKEFSETGLEIDAIISEELLLTIFYHNTALHDGAVIISNDRLMTASALLPLSGIGTGSYHLGTRHRAALGLTEATDAVVVVVSEETGVISLAYDGRLIRNLDKSRLTKLLRAFHRPQLENEPPTWRKWIDRLPFSSRLGLKTK